MGLFDVFDTKENSDVNIILFLKKEYPSFKFIRIKNPEDHLVDNAVINFNNYEMFMAMIEMLINSNINSDLFDFSKTIFYDNYYLYFIYLGEKVRCITCSLE